MKLLLDQGLARGCALVLRDFGHDAIHVGDLGLQRADDDEILSRATAESRVIVTLDADFHASIAVSGATKPSVIRLRLEGLSSLVSATLINDLVRRFETDLTTGSFLTVDHTSARLRKLPIR
jgi:predicted nuclease of predicted toxin-antitoxin system